MRTSDLIPSRLIVLRRYPDRMLAEADRDLLIEAGIPAYVKRGFMGDAARVLMVGEENVTAAVEALGGSDHDLQEAVQDEALQCTRCRSRDIAPLPPYAALSIAVGLAAGVAALWLGRERAFLPVLGVTILISTAVYARSPRWRCRMCGLRYGQPARRGTRQYEHPR
jgi:hypothetical protein